MQKLSNQYNPAEKALIKKINGRGIIIWVICYFDKYSSALILDVVLNF